MAQEGGGQAAIKAGNSFIFENMYKCADHRFGGMGLAGLEADLIIYLVMTLFLLLGAVVTLTVVILADGEVSEPGENYQDPMDVSQKLQSNLRSPQTKMGI